MAIELFENKTEHFLIIKDGSAVLKLSEAEFNAMKKVGTSPLLRRLWDQAKLERKKGGM